MIISKKTDHSGRIARLSIGTKLLLPILLSMGLGLAALSMLVARENSIVVEALASGAGDEMAHRIASGVEAELIRPLQIATTLRDTFVRMERSGVHDRTVYLDLLQDVVAANPDCVGGWTIWDVDGLGALIPDAQRLVKGSNEDSSFSPYAVNHGDDTSIEVLNDYNINGQGDYYLVAHRTGRETIVEPYHYKVDGKDHLITSIALPIIIDGKIMGVLGLDASLDGLSQRFASMRPYQSGGVTILSNTGLIVASAGASMLGDASEKWAPSLAAAKSRIAAGEAFSRAGWSDIIGAEAIEIFVPTKIGATNAPWSVVVSLPTSALLAPAQRIAFYVAAAGLLLLIALAILVVVVVRGVMTRPIAKLVASVKRVTAGDTVSAVHCLARSDELGTMAGAISELQTRTADLDARNAEYAELVNYQAATIDVLKVMSSAINDSQPVFDVILLRAMQICGAIFGSLLEYDGKIQRVRATHGLSEDALRAYESAFPRPALGDFASERALIHGTVEYLPDTPSTSPVRKYDLVSFLAVPLIYNGRAIGVLSLGHRESHAFTSQHIEILKNFADQAVISIGSTETFRALQNRTADLTEALEQQTATAEVLKIISRSAFDLPTVLDTLVSSASRLCASPRAVIYLLRGGLLHLEAAYDISPEWPGDRRLVALTLGHETPSGRCALSGQFDHIPDLWDDSDFAGSEFLKSCNDRATLNVPLLCQDVTIGVLSFSRPEPGPFAPSQIELAHTFADQAVIAIENTRLFNEVQARTDDLIHSLEELRSTQDRLVQTEKLASLGQLTAGIAHEIKNPLNFVNNFSDLSIDLLDELAIALAPEAIDLPANIRDEVDDLTTTLKSNLGKITQHGQRADSIVKNMLLHSRTGASESRLLDINALAEEALQLAYHGARAENSQFNITLEKQLATDAGMVEVYPQEFTRVLLNLFGNGFYAAAKFAKDGVEPSLLLATRDLGEHVEIRVRDNGIGMTEVVRSKIFEPFFTTKPAGEGTGLGLSLSYDIIVKQHSGSIIVDSEVNQFTEFTITLPRVQKAGDRL